MALVRTYKGNGTTAIPYRTTIAAISGGLQTRLQNILTQLEAENKTLSSSLKEKLNQSWPILEMPGDALCVVSLESVDGLKEIMEFINDNYQA